MRICPYGSPEVGGNCGQPGCVHTCPRCLRPGHTLDACTDPDPEARHAAPSP